MHVDLGTLTRVDPGQFGAVGGRDRRADRAVALSYTDVVTQTACWEERSQVCDEIRLALAEVRRRTPCRACVGPPRDDAKAHRTWDRGRRSSSSSSSIPSHLIPSHPIPSRPVSSHHITSHHITSHHITSHHITSHHITSHHITSHHITSHHITSHHITSLHITSRHITSHHVTSHHITSHHTTPHHSTSHHITSYHITSHHITKLGRPTTPPPTPGAPPGSAVQPVRGRRTTASPSVPRVRASTV